MSRIHRGGGAVVEGMRWRLAGTNHPQTPATPDSQLASAKSSPVLEREIELRIERAREEARAEAEASALAAVAARLDPALKAFQAMIHNLASEREKLRFAAEEDVVKLAIAIARRVLNRELSTDPSAMLGLVKAAFGKLNARELHRLRMAPSDQALVEQHRGNLEFPERLQIVADASLVPGSAIFETSRGEVDASTGTQLVEIDRGLCDVLQQHRR